MAQTDLKKNNNKKTEKELARWRFLMQYYRWFFMLFFLVCAMVLFLERLILPGICMVVFAWYVAPLAYIRKFDQKLGKARRIILMVSMLFLAVGFTLLLFREG